MNDVPNIVTKMIEGGLHLAKEARTTQEKQHILNDLLKDLNNLLAVEIIQNKRTLTDTDLINAVTCFISETAKALISIPSNSRMVPLIDDAVSILRAALAEYRRFDQ